KGRVEIISGQVLGYSRVLASKIPFEDMGNLVLEYGLPRAIGIDLDLRAQVRHACFLTLLDPRTKRGVNRHRRRHGHIVGTESGKVKWASIPYSRPHYSDIGEGFEAADRAVAHGWNRWFWLQRLVDVVVDVVERRIQPPPGFPISKVQGVIERSGLVHVYD